MARSRLDDLSRFVEPPHMGVARGEETVWNGRAGIVLDCLEQLRRRLIVPVCEEIRLTHQDKVDPSLARAEAERGLDMLHCDIVFSRP